MIKVRQKDSDKRESLESPSSASSPVLHHLKTSYFPRSNTAKKWRSSFSYLHKNSFSIRERWVYKNMLSPLAYSTCLWLDFLFRDNNGIGMKRPLFLSFYHQRDIQLPLHIETDSSLHSNCSSLPDQKPERLARKFVNTVYPEPR